MAAPLRIGVNALYLIPGGVGGSEIYLRHLLAGLAAVDAENEYFVFTNRETDAGLAPTAGNFRQVRQRVSASVRPARILWEQTVLPYRTRRLRLDALLNPGFTSPLVGGAPNVTVFFDLQHERHPEFFRWWDLPFWRLLLAGSVRSAARLVAISEATRGDLARVYGLERESVELIPPGVDDRFFRIAAERRAEPYLLTVSTLHPHKNLDLLLRAFARFRAAAPEFRLVVAGMRGFAAGELERLRDELGLAERVTFTGWIEREELYSLYARAHAMVLPSRFEGFGMPLSEALAAGIPTACSGIEPLRSIAAGAAVLFDPGDVGSMAAAMERVTFDEELRARLAAAGPRRAADFSWEASARSMLRVVREAAASKAGRG